MEHLEEGEIHAWLDGALSADESERLEAHASACQPCRGAIAEARGLIAASSRIIAALDGVPQGVLPAARVPAAREPARADTGGTLGVAAGASAVETTTGKARPRAWWNRPGLAAAALLIVAVGRAIVTGTGSEAVVRETNVAADSSIASASTATASAAPSDVSAPASSAPVTTPPLAQALAKAGKSMAKRDLERREERVGEPRQSRARAEAAPAPAIDATIAAPSEKNTVARAAASEVAVAAPPVADRPAPTVAGGNPQSFNGRGVAGGTSRAVIPDTGRSRRSAAPERVTALSAVASAPNTFAPQASSPSIDAGWIGCIALSTASAGDGQALRLFGNRIRLTDSIVVVGAEGWSHAQQLDAARGPVLQWRALSPSTARLRAFTGRDTIVVNIDRVNGAGSTFVATRIPCP